MIANVIKQVTQRRLSHMIAFLLCYVFIADRGLAEIQIQQDSPALPSALSLKKFLQTLDGNKETRYVATFKDLNGDGTPEAIVYMVGSEWCGSGGCNTLIFSQQAGSWKTITDISVTQIPIRVLQSKSEGWRNIAVSVGGGGIPVGYEAELRFDGKTYPDNPTVPPARRALKHPAGDEVISSSAREEPLYP